MINIMHVSEAGLTYTHLLPGTRLEYAMAPSCPFTAARTHAVYKGDGQGAVACAKIYTKPALVPQRTMTVSLCLW